MMRFNNKFGAIALVALAAVYMIVSLVTGRSAASEVPPELSAPEAGVDVWQASALLVRERAAIIDTRAAEQYALYHVPGSVSVPDGDAGDVLRAAGDKAVILVVTESDAKGATLAGQVRELAKEKKAHFLREGARGWYLTYELPVPLFSDKPPPHGWTASMGQVRAYFAKGEGVPEEVILAIGKLSTAGYTPTQLEGKKKAAAGGAKKKISGGCGG